MLLTIHPENDRPARRVYGPLHPVSSAVWRATGESWVYWDGYLYPICGERVKVPWEIETWARRHVGGQKMPVVEVDIELPDLPGKGVWRKARKELFS